MNLPWLLFTIFLQSLIAPAFEDVKSLFFSEDLFHSKIHILLIVVIPCSEKGSTLIFCLFFVLVLLVCFGFQSLFGQVGNVFLRFVALSFAVELDFNGVLFLDGLLQLKILLVLLRVHIFRYRSALKHCLGVAVVHLIIVHLTRYLLLSSHLKQVYPLSHVLVSRRQWGGGVDL